MPRRSWTLLVALACAAPLSAGAQADSVRDARLAALGRLFGVVKYFHPAFLERYVPWDSVVVTAIDEVRDAKSRDEYRGAIARLLASLRDSASRLAPTEPAAKPPTDTRTSRRWEISGADSTLVIAIPDFTDYVGVRAFLSEGAPDIRRAGAIVFDLRGAPADDEGTASYAFSVIQALLPASTLQPPPHRRRMHSGFAPQSGATSGGYWSGTYETFGSTIRVTTPNRSRRTVFLVNTASDIPEVAFALRSAGQGGIVVEGTSPILKGAGDTHSIDMGEGIVASVRIGEVVGAADADVAVSNSVGALRMAVELSRQPAGVAAPPVARPSFAAPAENPYPGMRYPTPAYRILAAYRYWNAIYYFYPYKHLIGEDWGATLPRIVRMVDAARLGRVRDVVGHYGDVHEGLTQRRHQQHRVDAASGNTASGRQSSIHRRPARRDSRG